MRLAKEVQRLTPTEGMIVDARMLTHPPTEYHALAMRLDIPSARIRSRLINAQESFVIALGPELRMIADGLKADLEASPSGSDVRDRIDALLGEVLPKGGGSVEDRTKRVFRHALAEQLNLEPKARGH